MSLNRVEDFFIADVGVALDIAEDQKLLTPKSVPQGFDMLAAFNRCVWFDGDP